MRKPSLKSMIKLAQYWAKHHNLFVFPVNKKKMPILGANQGFINPKYGVGGYALGTTDLEEIENLFRAAQNYQDVWGVGCHAGESGLIIIDADLYNENIDAAEAYIEELPKTTTSITAGGGLHLWYKYPENSPVTIGTSKNGLPPNIDIRAYFGHFVLPGSFSYKGEYKWLDGHSLSEIEPAALPADLLEILIENNTYAKDDSIDYSGEAFYTEENVSEMLQAESIPFTLRHKPGIAEFDLHQCLNPEHNHESGSAIILTVAGDETGKIGYRCHHDSCAGWNWSTVRNRLTRHVLIEEQIPVNVDFEKIKNLFQQDEQPPDYPYNPSIYEALNNIQPMPFQELDIYLKKDYGAGNLFADLLHDYLLWDSAYRTSNDGWLAWGGQYWVETRFHILDFFARSVGWQFDYHVSVDQTKINKLNKKLQDIEDKIDEQSRGTDEYSRLKIKHRKTKRKIQRQENKTLIQARKDAFDRRKIENALGFATIKTTVAAQKLDSNPLLLGCVNGIIDLEIGAFRNGQPEDYIKTVCPTKWRGIDEPCERWQQFISEIMGHDSELIEFMHRLLGYSMSGLTDEHVFPILWGEHGRNGKSVLVETLNYVLGNIASPINEDLILSKKNPNSGGATPHIAGLRGKRIGFISETKQTARLDEAMVKKATGGDSLTGRFLHQNEFTFAPTHTIFLLTNAKPKINAGDSAMWERVKLIPFVHRFVDEPQGEFEHLADKELAKKLRAESSGILAWLLKGFIKWRESGLMVPESVKVATAEYRSESDTLTAFVEECCVIDAEAHTSKNDLYSAYKDWAESEGIAPVFQMQKSNLIKRIIEKFPDDIKQEIKRPYIDGKQKKLPGLTGIQVIFKMQNLPN